MLTYTVQPGDTMFGIANRFGVSVQAIMQANNLANTLIFVGQVLRIPVAGPGPGPGPGPIPGPGPSFPPGRQLEQRVTRLEREVNRQSREINQLERRVRRLEQGS